MKANQNAKKFSQNQEAYTKIVGGLVALLITIVIGVMIYWEVETSVDSFEEQTQTFTGYSHGNNASAQTITLDNSPNSASDTNITCYSSTAGTLSYPTFSLSHKTVTITAGSASNYTQVNATYTSHLSTDASESNDMSGTVFSLLPIVALVVVASIILAIVLGFGGGKKGL